METRTKDVVIDLHDDPDDDIRIARMEMELFTWREALKKEGFRVVNIDMGAVDSETAHAPDGSLHVLNVTFRVTMFIVPKEK